MSRHSINPDVRKKSSYAKIAWYEAIMLYKKKMRINPTMIEFNKTVTLAQLRLEKKGIDVQIPYCWHLYGTECKEYNGSVNVDRDINSSLYVDWNDDVPDIIRDDEITLELLETIKQVFMDYMEDDHLEKCIDEVYSYAPFKFQDDYRKVRIKLHQTGMGSKYRTQIKTQSLVSLLSEAMRHFPEEDFPALAKFTDSVLGIIRLINSNIDPKEYWNTSTEIIEAFWSVFCYHLRPHEKGHHEISEEKLTEWTRWANIQYDVFKRNFGDIIVELAEKFNDIPDDPKLSKIYHTRWAEKKDEDEEFEMNIDCMDGLSDTLKLLYPIE